MSEQVNYTETTNKTCMNKFEDARMNKFEDARSTGQKEENIMGKSYKPITSMKEVPEQLRKLRRQYLRYQQAEIIYSISHKKFLELASDAGAIYRIDGTVLIKHWKKRLKKQRLM